jgi:hypothetical protein
MLVAICLQSNAQELFVYTEPASNMAAKGIGIRLTNSLMKKTGSDRYNYHLIPEVMIGLSRNWMLHGEVFVSDRDNSLVAEGGALYLKYRFYSRDDVHSHFRIAGWARGSVNNSDIHQQAIDLNGHNSGIETGLIATKLINKVAVSSGISYMYAAYNSKGNKFSFGEKNRNAIGYNLSVGKLMLPKEYTSYDQVNMNLMAEVLGQTNLHTGDTYVDLAPSIQFIFKSRLRLDLGYRLPLLKDLQRTAPAGGLLRFEYNLFNVF